MENRKYCLDSCLKLWDIQTRSCLEVLRYAQRCSEMLRCAHVMSEKPDTC